MGAFADRKNKLVKNKKMLKITGLSVSVFSLALFILLCLPLGAFSTFFLGAFGVSIYALCLVGVLFGVGVASASKYQLSKRYFVFLIVNFLSLAALLHTIFSAGILRNGGWSHFEGYLSNCFNAEPRLTVGGLLMGVIVFPVRALLGVVGTCVVFAIVLCIFVGLSVDFFVSKRVAEPRAFKKNENRRLFENEKEIADISSSTLSTDFSVSAAKVVPKKFEDEDDETRYQKFRERLTLKQDYFSNRLTVGDSRRPIVSSVIHADEIERSIEKPAVKLVPEPISDTASEQTAQSTKSDARKILFAGTVFSEKAPTLSQANSPSTKPAEDEVFPSKYDPEKFKSKKDYILTPILPDYLNHKNRNRAKDGKKIAETLENSKLFEKAPDLVPPSKGISAKEILFDKSQNELPFSTRTFPPLFPSAVRTTEPAVKPAFEPAPDITPSDRLSNLFDQERLKGSSENFKKHLPFSLERAPRLSDLVERVDEEKTQASFKRFEKNEASFSAFSQNVRPVQPSFIPSSKPIFEKTEVDKRYVAPDTKLLKVYPNETARYVEDFKEKSRILEETLESFKINAKVTNVVRGPSVTRYEISIPPGIPVRKVATYESDLAMALMSKAGIRMEVPIPGKNAVGVEIPNEVPSTVGLKELLESREFVNSSGSLPVAIGKGISGEVVVKSLSKLVHTLVAGSTGSGKSVFLHSVIMSLMFKSSPEQLRFILIDPKCVEFSVYNNMPHLMLPNVITETDKAINALSWAVKEMDRRYKLLQENMCQNIESFLACSAVRNGTEKKIPNIVIVIDELAELMAVGKKEVEEKIRRLSQKGRASGIYLVVATQRPSVDVVTGTIKTNLPTRVALALASFIDSRTVLDEGGAEKLLGHGDMLFSPQGSNAIRLQGAFVSIEEEILPVIEFIKRNNAATYDESIEKSILEGDTPVGADSDGFSNDEADGVDEFFFPALRLFVETGSASTSMIQRRFGLGFPRASRLIDQMEVKGYISPQNGSKKRNVYVNMEQYRELSGDED